MFREECESKLDSILMSAYQSWNNSYPPQLLRVAQREFGAVFSDTDDVVVISNRNNVIVAGAMRKVQLKAEAIDGIFASMCGHQDQSLR